MVYQFIISTVQPEAVQVQVKMIPSWNYETVYFLLFFGFVASGVFFLILLREFDSTKDLTMQSVSDLLLSRCQRSQTGITGPCQHLHTHATNQKL